MGRLPGGDRAVATAGRREGGLGRGSMGAVGLGLHVHLLLLLLLVLVLELVLVLWVGNGWEGI